VFVSGWPRDWSVNSRLIHWASGILLPALDAERITRPTDNRKEECPLFHMEGYAQKGDQMSLKPLERRGLHENLSRALSGSKNPNRVYLETF